MKVQIEVIENKKRRMIMGCGNCSGKFSEDDFKGDLTAGGGLSLINLEDGRQFEVNIRDILSAIKKELEHVDNKR